jgi:hypothetical protein
MPSKAYQRWRSARAHALNEIEGAHTAVGGTGRGRRYATQQVNHAYAVLLASQFQGFCRDLHWECVEHMVNAIAPPPGLRNYVRSELTRGRQLDQRSAQPASLGADFGRFGLGFWAEVERYGPRNTARKGILELLNCWRNAIAHQDFDPTKLGGTATLRLVQVRKWRATCAHLAAAFDEVMRRYLEALTGISPW